MSGVQRPDLFVSTASEPTAAYVCVRVTATHRDAARCVASSPLNSSSVIVQIKCFLFFI